MVEHTPDKGAVAGSSPASPTISIRESDLTNLFDNVCETSNIKFDNFFGLYWIFIISKLKYLVRLTDFCFHVRSDQVSIRAFSGCLGTERR